MFVITPDFVFKQVLYVRFYTYFSVKVVISRLLVQDILPVNSPYARIRLRDSLVIACRGFIRDFKPKPTHFVGCSLSLSYKDRICRLSLP